MTKRRSLKIGKSFYLPIGITMQITERYRPKKKILTKKEAQLKLKKQLERYLMKKAKAGAKIVHCEGNYKKKRTTDMKLRHRSSKKKVSERSETSRN